MSSSATKPLLPAFIFPSSHALAGSNAEHHGRFPRPPLPDTSPDPKLDNAAIYVHPLVRKSYTKLSDKSLEMCTESLGSETGSDAMGETMLGPSTRIRRKVTKLATRGRLEYNYRPFPPPLTSIGDSVSLECCRENGRLVVNAVIGTETSDSLFQAERVDGRLRLRIKKGAREEDEVDETNGEVEEGEETERSVFWGEDFDGNMENVEGRIGIDEKFSRIGGICGILRNVGLLPDLFPTFSNLY